MIAITDWLACPRCGDEVIESDAECLFQEDRKAVCVCGARCVVQVDDNHAYLSWSCEHGVDENEPCVECFAGGRYE